jgi:HD-GYP domain-containing protein (c-di-GMP phosphodiesterase class II)
VGVKQIKIDVNEVMIGMFVSGLDRPWTQTPFPLQGFYVRDLEEINQLKSQCHHIYIDVLKGARPATANLKTMTSSPRARMSNLAMESKTSDKITGMPALRTKHNFYPVTEELREEMAGARDLHRQVFDAVSQIIEQLNSGDAKGAIIETKRAASAMVGSVLRCPDAFTWLTRVKQKDEYTYSHAVRSAIWGILLGRHMGLSKMDLEVLAMGLLLKDVGKTRLSSELITKKDRTPLERAEYERFVMLGVESLEKTPDVGPRVISVVKTHMERINGSGFPHRLRGEKIPLLGRIAAVVTFYDEVTNPRGEKYPLSPSKAVAQLYEGRDTLFQGDLVVEFIRAIGLYPTGTLVELNTGEVAVVVEQNFERRLKPHVMVVMDPYKRELAEPIYLDMAADDKQKQAKIDAGKLTAADVEWVEIAQDLEPGAYDIDVIAVCEDYMARTTKGGKGGLFGFLKGKRIVNIFGV